MSFNSKNAIFLYDNLSSEYLPYEVMKAENEDIITTNQDGKYAEDDNISLRNMYDFLYHGIRFQDYLEKLESIFRERKILAGKFIPNYHSYSDNCNKGEYVSVLNVNKTDSITFRTFIDENISLLITPFCDAVETKYVGFNIWNQIKDLNLKQIYSYLPGECMCKDFIPLEFVKAVGVPYRHLIRTKGRDYADKLVEDIVSLMESYNISLPVVEPGRMNTILSKPNNELVNNTVERKSR